MVSKNLMQMSTDIVKLDRFDGGSFKCWQKKMQFLLARWLVAYVEKFEDETLAASRERLKTIPRLGNSEMLSRNVTSQKTQQHILSMFTQNNMNMNESIQVTSIIDKLPSTWKDVKKSLKHRKDDLSLKDLGKHLLIEEKYRLENKVNDDTSNVHVVEKKGESVERNVDTMTKTKRNGGNDNKNKDKNFVAMISEAFSLEEEKSWWVESGATWHVCNDQAMFKTYEPSESMLYMGNHSTAQVKGNGKIDLIFTYGNTLTLKDVLHALDVRKNLVSGSLLNKFGFKLVVESDKFILSKGGKFVGKGYHTSGMCKLNIKDVVNSSVNDVNMTEVSNVNNASAGIPRLCHVYFKRMRNMANANLIPKLDSKNDKCQTCMHTKITRPPFPTIHRSSKILELVHSDVRDLHATPTSGEKKYFSTFIDDYSRYCYVYLLHSKDEVFEKFKIYKNEVELKCDTRIKCLRTDRGGEYYDPRYFQSSGIVNQVTAPYTPQQNGIAERKNRTLMDMVNSMMSYFGLSSGYWGEALLTACYILNRVPS
uniref:Zinc finger, CCHC-type n=1 Tax=Tanacetum cinerariifolium TaxID=118510 RepID=A0A6L2JNT2_TANCI|nr:zinc finger, CCHC-type [Tanacetum cinerariifolium]